MVSVSDRVVSRRCTVANMQYLHMKLYFLFPSHCESPVVPQGSTLGPLLFMLGNINQVNIPWIRSLFNCTYFINVCYFCTDIY